MESPARRPSWRIRVLLRALLLVVPLLAPTVVPWGAHAADPPQAPLLRLEAGGHAGSVPRLALDRSGRILASAGFDKTVRLWALEDRDRPDKGQLAVLRPPIGPGEEGELYAVAVAPDARRVYAAGATGGRWNGTFSVYVFDTERAQLLGAVQGLPAPVNDLAISRDGTRLAAGLASGGVRAWDTARMAQVLEDRAYSGPVRALVFDAQDRLLVTSADGRVRSYDRGGRKLAEAQPQPALRPWGIASSPDGDLVAVAYENAGADGRLRVDVLNARTLTAAFSPDTAGLRGEGLLAVAWAPDGRGGVQLLAGGYARAGGVNVIRRWNDFGLGAYADLPAARDTVLHLVAVPGGGAVYAADDPGWGRIAGDGRVIARPDPPLLDLRPARERLAVSADGLVVELQTGDGLKRFDAGARRLQAAARPDQRLQAARTGAPGLQATGWRDSTALRLNGVPVALARSELARSLAVLPGDEAVLVGTDTALRLVSRDGRPLAQAEVPAAAWAVAASGNGRTAVAALLDGTVRWYGMDPAAGTLEERAALFVQPAPSLGRDRWVLYTPEGFFDHSDGGGQSLVGVHLNRGRTQQPEWVSFSQAYRVLFAPSAVIARMRGDSGPATRRLAELGDLRNRFARQPGVSILSACVPRPDGACAALPVRREEAVRLPAGAAQLRLTVGATDRGMGLGPVDVFVNDRNAGRSTPVVARGAQNGVVTVDVSLDPGENLVQARAYDGAGAIFTESAPLRLAGPAGEGAQGGEGGAAAGPGRLFVVAVGIDRFADPRFKLGYAVADATGFANLARSAGAPLFRQVEVALLTDEAATRAGILDALEQAARQAGPGDTVLFYAATHGVRSPTDGRFLLVPQDVATSATGAGTAGPGAAPGAAPGEASGAAGIPMEALARSAIDEASLVAALSRIRARNVLLLLDTCHSGQVSAESLAPLGHETGRYLLAASSSVQEALDSYDNRNGVFLYAIREGMQGRAAADAEGVVSALSLGEYVTQRVGELARQKGHEQDAVFRSAQRDLRRFPLGKLVR